MMMKNDEIYVILTDRTIMTDCYHELKSSAQLASIGGRVTAYFYSISTYQLYNFSVSEKRLSTSEQLSTTMYTPFFRLAKQQPAVNV